MVAVCHQAMHHIIKHHYTMQPSLPRIATTYINNLKQTCKNFTLTIFKLILKSQILLCLSGAYHDPIGAPDNPGVAVHH